MNSLHFDTPPAWIAALQAWAADNPRVLRVWLFGSRVHGVRTPKESPDPVPDLDVAYELADYPDETATTLAMFEGPRWRRRLEETIGVKVDLQLLDADTPTVRSYMKVGRLLIYERPQT